MSPQGEFLDLDIDSTKDKPGFNGEQNWNSGMKVMARIDEKQKIWYGEMRICNKAQVHIKSITSDTHQR